MSLVEKPTTSHVGKMSSADREHLLATGGDVEKLAVCRNLPMTAAEIESALNIPVLGGLIRMVVASKIAWDMITKL